MAAKKPPFETLKPDLQVAFYYRLQAVRDLHLREALRKAVEQVDLRALDAQLAKFVKPQPLRAISAQGLRGEVLFPVPCLLETDPHLLGYYRLLLGFSQKQCYSQGPFGRFKRMEEEGELPERLVPLLPALCRSWISSAEILLDGIGDITLDAVHELQLLTLGPQFRGSENTRIGEHAAQQVFDLLRDAVSDHLLEETRRTLVLESREGKRVAITFAADPDVQVRERSEEGLKPLLCIEIKGGSDISNVHNRIGEAEKSHQKAKAAGFPVCWTILRADVDAVIAQQESPSTDAFFNLNEMLEGTEELSRFRDVLGDLIGVNL